MKSKNRFITFITNRLSLEIISLFLCILFRVNKIYLILIILFLFYKVTLYFISNRKFEISKTGISVGSANQTFLDFDSIAEINFYSFYYFIGERTKIIILLVDGNKVKLCCDGMLSVDDTDQEDEIGKLFSFTKSVFNKTNFFEGFLKMRKTY